MGLKLYPSEVQSFASEISANVAALAGQLENSYSKIEDFEGEKELDGVSWGGTKQQLASHKYVIRGILAAGDMMSEDARRLTADVGDEILDEDVIQDQLYTQQKLKEEVEQSLQYYRYRHGRTLPDGTVLNFGNIISSYTDVLNTCIAWIQTYQEKLERLYAINSSTGSLFQGAIDLFNAVSVVNAAVIGSWNGKEYTAAAPAEAVDLIMGGWENTKTSRELRRAGITMEQIQNMEGLGYTPEEVLDIWECCETDIDRNFFKCLLTGTRKSYEKAFQYNPDDVSGFMMAITADYSARIFEIGADGNLTPAGKKAFEEFNNALLASNRIYSYDAEGQTIMTDRLYRDVYLDRIFSMTQKLAKGQAALVGALSSADAGYREQVEKLEKLVGLTDFWIAEILLKENLERFEGETGEIEIALDQYHEGAIIFSFNHFSPTNGDYAREKVYTEIQWNPNDLDNEWSLQRLQDLKERTENIWKDTLTSFLEGTSLIVLGTVAPEMVIVVSAMYMMLNEGKGQIGGAGELIDGIKAKTGMEIGAEALSGLIGGLAETIEADNTLTDEEWKAKMEWFGSGGKYVISYSNILLDPDTNGTISHADIYNPKVIEGIKVWENSGVAGWMGWDESKVDAITKGLPDALERLKFSKDNLDECKRILSGGYDILDMQNIVEFNECIQAIENAYHWGGEGFDGDINIQSEWRKYTEWNQGEQAGKQ